MILYTINNVYPDKNFCFTIDARNLGLVATEHTHVINNFRNLKNTLELYSDKDHPHQRLDSLKINDNVLLNEITINQSGNFYVSIKDEHTILLEFRAEKQNKIGGLKNSNPNKAHNILKLWTGNLSETDEDTEDLFKNIDESELIILKGDNL